MSYGQRTILGLLLSTLALLIYAVACPFMLIGKGLFDLARFVDPDYPAEYGKYEAAIVAEREKAKRDSGDGDGGWKK